MADPPPFLYDVQTGVLRGVKAPLVAYLFFRITDRQTFVEQLPAQPDVSDRKGNGLGLRVAVFHSEGWRSNKDTLPVAPVALANVAFTYSGLRALGVHERTLESFPEAFREGMARRASALGDIGPASPELWDGYLGSREIHGVAWSTFHYPKLPPSQDDIVKWYGILKAAVATTFPLIGPTDPRQGSANPQARTGVSEFDPEPGAIPGAEVLHGELGMANYRRDSEGERPYRIEHFGFRDGVSQPYANIGLDPPAPGGGTPRPGDSWAPVARGEILLGHPDEGDQVQLLPGNRQLRHNGTYMVFRKLEQDVLGFRNFMKRHDNSGIPDRLASQMVGRWPDGTSLVSHPDGPQALQSSPSKQVINDFRYQADDPGGARCPIGAHIRRANPRDTNDRDEARQHRLFRRGISYGGQTLPPDSPGDGDKRGLLFITMQTRIDRQFELVQADWLNRGELAGQAGAHFDPLNGLHAGRVSDAFQAVERPAPITCLPRFVTPRGGDYFFVPSFTALACLKAGYNFAPDDPDAPYPADAIGSILPSRTDNSADLVALGKRLLAVGQPPCVPLPPVTMTPFPGGPQFQVKTFVVGRYEFVKDVLDHDATFSNRPFDTNSRAITGGQGLLIGLAASDPERAKRLRVLHDALTLLGPPPVDRAAKRLTRAALDRVRPTGRLDVVGDFGRVVPVLAAGALFGIVGPGFVSPTGIATRFQRQDVTDMPDDWLRGLPAVEDHAKPLATMQVWTRLSFLQIFVNLADAAEIATSAERAAREMLRHVDALVLQARSRARSGSPRNLLEALVKVPLDLADQPDPGRHVRLLLTEFTAGAVETLNAALTNAINYLLDHEDELKQVICQHVSARFTCQRETTLDTLIREVLTDQELDALINEILRFDPMGPLAFRTCEQSSAAIGGVPVDRGAVVCLVPAAALLDPAAFPTPETIRLDRPPDKYLHFGAGLHRCGGLMFAVPLLREMFRAIAGQPRLRRAAGIAGTKRQTFPLLCDGLTVRFEPPAS